MMDVLETCVYATDLEAARAFYGDLLGMECFVRAEGRHAFFRAGRSVFLVFNPEATEQEEKLPPHGARGSVHVCFRVDDDDERAALQEKLEAAGYETTEAEWPKGRSFYAYDPAGNLVEFAPARIWGIE